jgi:putative IMPACT (imprinted ancient) family translation regulator
LTARRAQAHVAEVHSRDDVRAVMQQLLRNNKIARATHNISAFRIFLDSGTVLADNDDDGEDAAGGKLAELLSLTDARNVLVVVSRWYGGIQLGPDRFRHINNVARLLLERHGYSQRAGAASAAADPKRKGKDHRAKR